MNMLWKCLAGISIATASLTSAGEAADPAAQQPPTMHPDVVTDHHGIFNGRPLAYKALVETFDVPTADDNAGVRLVTYAYVGQPKAASERPVIFLFNGGPIVPSTILQVGGVGPKRVLFPDDVTKGPDALKLIDNHNSLLDVGDLVFIDVASTGYSRVLPGGKPQDYFNVEADAQEVTSFIKEWLDKHGRRTAPIFIVGESYGTIRAPVVADMLTQGPRPIVISGMVLLGQATNIIEYSQRPANIMSYVLSLPTLAATAWYHHKIVWQGRTLDGVIGEAQGFARDVYLPALYRGTTLSPVAKADVASGLERLTGIPKDYYIAHDLRITKEQFRGELLKGEGRLLGRADARFTAPIGPDGVAPDPSAPMELDQLNSFFMRYLRDDLKVDWKETYLTQPPVSDRLHWDYGGGATPFSDWPFPDHINKMMRLNPRFRLFVGNGSYDTQTTMGGAAYLFDQQHWADRAELHFYPGGHALYTDDASNRELADDLRAFIRSGVGK